MNVLQNQKGEVCTKLTFKNPSLESASDVFVYYTAVFDNQICIKINPR